jgi:hypothetical protein
MFLIFSLCLDFVCAPYMILFYISFYLYVLHIHKFTVVWHFAELSMYIRKSILNEEQASFYKWVNHVDVDIGFSPCFFD